MKIPHVLLACWCGATVVPQVAFAQPGPSYRLSAVDLNQRVIWGAECRLPADQGLAFGGQDQDADNGRPHTRILVQDRWQAIHEQLQSANPLQEFRDRAWAMRCAAKNLTARARFIYFQGLPATAESALLQKELIPARARLLESTAGLIHALQAVSGGKYDQDQAEFAVKHLEPAIRRMPDVREGN